MSYSPTFFGNNQTIPSKSTGTDFTNNSGGTLAKLTPVRIDNTGDLQNINVALETAKDIVGIVDSDIVNGATGTVINDGRLTDISVSSDFGSELYISKAGAVTDQEPTIGVGGFVAGDFVISIGKVIKNLDNPTLKDLLVEIDVRGTL